MPRLEFSSEALVACTMITYYVLFRLSQWSKCGSAQRERGKGTTHGCGQVGRAKTTPLPGDFPTLGEIPALSSEVLLPSDWPVQMALHHFRRPCCALVRVFGAVTNCKSRKYQFGGQSSAPRCPFAVLVTLGGTSVQNVGSPSMRGKCAPYSVHYVRSTYGLACQGGTWVRDP